MVVLSRKLASLLGAAALAATFMGLSAIPTAAAGAATCSGGTLLSPTPIAATTYRSLTIDGNCAVISGNVVVTRNLTILGGGSLNAAFAFGTLSVGNDLLVRSGGLLLLGCEPFTGITCFDDPSMASSHSIGHNLVATGAVLVIAHHNTIWGEVAQTGGGGGIPCVPVAEGGPPPYSTYEDNQIHGDVTVADMHTCWAGFFRNTVWGDVNWNDNHTWDGHLPDNPTVDGDDDGNEVATNTIYGDLSCFDNVPAVQFGDSGGLPNSVSGQVRGQCTATSAGPG